MKKKILFVDDDRILRNLVSKKLEPYSGTVTTLLAEDGIKAVQILKDHHVSLVITDIQMPEMNGYALLAEMSGKYPDIPKIILTGYSTPTSKKRAMDIGATAYIEKPFVVEKLVSQILQILKKENEGGTLQTVSMEMFIQLIEMEQKTCTVRVFNKATEKQGVLFFHKGDIMDARINDRKGNAPAYEIMAWDNATISIQNDCALTEKRVKGTLMAILFDAMRIKDEAASKPEKFEEDLPVPMMMA